MTIYRPKAREMAGFNKNWWDTGNVVEAAEEKTVNLQEEIPEEEAERVIHNTGRVDAAGHFEAANQNHALNDEHEDHEGIGRLVEHRTLPHR